MIEIMGTEHGYDTAEIPADCKDIRRDGQKTEEGVDWEETEFTPKTPSNKIVRMLECSNWNLTRISVHRPT